MKDSTGAGDAFGAALVSGLYKKDEVGFEDLRAAIKKARVWAAYACRTIGGANEPPDMAALNKFEADVKGRGFDDSYGIESYTIKHADTILRLVDLAYPLPFVGLK